MANYDAPGLTYDSGVFYDALFVPPTNKKRMAKVKLNMKGLSDLQTIQQCVSIKTALTGNADFTTPTPTLTAFGTLITSSQNALTAMDNAVSAAKQATVDKDNALVALLAGVDQLATYVQLTSAGDEAKILSAGFTVRAPRKPAGVPTQVMTLFITAGDSAQYGTDLYGIDNDQQAPTMKTFYPESCGAIARHVRSVPFIGNAALIFMNAPGMAHGASIPRDATQATRYAYQFYVGPPKDDYGRLIRRLTPAQQAACGAAGAADSEEGY